MKQQRTTTKLTSPRRPRMRRSSTSSAYSSRAERTRTKLVQAAIEEFASEGFHETKVSDIVARAGLTQPTFYLYFKSKEAIQDYLVQKVHDELLEVVDRARLPAQLPHPDVMTKARSSIRAFIQYFIDNPKLAMIGYFPPEAGTVIREKITELVARNIVFEQRSGYFRRDMDAMFISHCYNGMIEQLIKSYIITKRLDADTLADRAADILLLGLLPNGIDDKS